MYVAAARTFLGDSSALTGQFAFSDRANGNLSRPYFPDGELGRPPGPFSRPVAEFNPFSTGLQSALVEKNIRDPAAFILGAGADTPRRCTQTPDVAPGQNPLETGVQIFPGSLPISSAPQLVVGIVVPGAGIAQADTIIF